MGCFFDGFYFGLSLHLGWGHVRFELWGKSEGCMEGEEGRVYACVF